VTLGLPDDEAHELHIRYYTQYGLALRGLMKHHGIDGLEFNRKCDGDLPLEDMLKPDAAVRQLLQDIDRTKSTVWGLTNAYSTHARRVLRILQLEDQIEGLVFCDYAQHDFACKPEPEFYVAVRFLILSSYSNDRILISTFSGIAAGWRYRPSEMPFRG